jgi:hypothetical protein
VIVERLHTIREAYRLQSRRVHNYLTTEITAELTATRSHHSSPPPS